MARKRPSDPQIKASQPRVVAARRDDTLVVYGGSFDPVTIGHLDVIHRASALFDRTVVAIGLHPMRKPLFTVQERLSMLREATAGIRGVEVSSFKGLLIHFCRRVGARVLVRGLRAVTDFEYELQIAHANADLEPAIETVFLPTRTKYGFISGSLVREIASHGGDVSNYASPSVCAALARKFGGR
jgi:pantetheine-phosphate adenylyltransferase